MKKGFTLIEVLIVVIILGILATLAIPQFSKMTRRATMAEAWAGLGGIRTAQAVYYMEHMDYAGCLNDLDFDVPAGAIYSYTVSSTANVIDYNAVATGENGTRANGIVVWLSQNDCDYDGI